MADNSLYSSSSNVKDRSRTYIPDIYRQSVNDVQAEQEPVTQGARTLKLQDRRIVGVLFSLSATANGEVFPLYIGRNFIGSDNGSDVYLPEETVSPTHAVILARKQADADGVERVVFSITDSDSEYGSMVNDEKMDFDKIYCNSGDIISIGLNYKLMLTIFDQEERLTVSSDFVRIEDEQINEDVAAENPLYAGTPDAQEPKEEVEVLESAGLDFYMPSKKPDDGAPSNRTIII